MKIHGTAGNPYRRFLSTPVPVAVPGAVDVTVTVPLPPPTVDVTVTVPLPPRMVDVTVGPAAVLVIVLVVAGGRFCRVKATRSPGTPPVPHVMRPAVIGMMSSIVPLAVAPTDVRTF